MYQKILQLAYIDDLLEAFKRIFCNDYGKRVGDGEDVHDFEDFENKFDTLLSGLEAQDMEVCCYARQARLGVFSKAFIEQR